MTFLSPSPLRMLARLRAKAVSHGRTRQLSFPTFQFSLFTSSSRKRDAFSLIEVILAIGVTSFALLGIFALFTTSLRTNKDSSAQQEGFEVQRILLSKFQDTNFTASGTLLSNMFKTNYVLSTTNKFFIYNSNNITLLTNSASGYSLTNGTLFYVLISASSNYPTNIFTKAGVNIQMTDFPNWPSFPARATVYAIPTASSTSATFLSNSAPVISFDLIIPK